MGAGGIKSLAAAKAPMSMGEILDVLVSKARLEAEDAQRVLLGALNGLAALMLLEDGAAQSAMAIKTYREVGLVAACCQSVSEFMIAPCRLKHVPEGEIVLVAGGVLGMLCNCHLLALRSEQP